MAKASLGDFTNRTLDAFLRSGMRNDHVKERGWRILYVRHGERYLVGRVKYDCLDLANLEARKPGHGAFTRLVTRIRKDYPHLAIYVENVLTPQFRDGLLRMGFSKVESSGIYADICPSFYMLPVITREASAFSDTAAHE